MRMLNILLAVVVMMLAVAGESKADDKAAPIAVTWATTIPSIELSGRPLEKVLAEIKQKLPGFDYSITRVNAPQDYPILPEMKLQNAPLDLFVRLMSQQFPDVTFGESQNGDGTVSLSVTIQPNSSAPQLVVRIFGLEDLIVYRSSLVSTGSKEDREKQATNDILSVIQAAADLEDDKSHPVMKVHAATHTLLFKGTAAQAEIAANALAALQPADDSHSLRGAFSTVVAENRELKEQLEKIKGATTQPITERDASTRPMPTTR